MRAEAQPGLPPEPTAPGTPCLLALEAGRPVARASLSLASDLVGAPGRTGMIGHYECLAPEAGAWLLRQAADELLRQGAERILGPMNGSTWARYRLALPREAGEGPFDPPWFSSEPRNPEGYPEHFRTAGFREEAWYESRAAGVEAGPPAFVDRLAGRLEREGFRERPFDPGHAEEELGLLHEASLAAFAENLYYSPISREGFLALYRPLVPRLDPDLVRLVLAPDGSLAAFVLAFPDPTAPGRVVLKTLATHPRWRNRGLGAFLTARVHEVAARRGDREVVHALMHVANASTGISGHLGGRRIRRYALYGLPS